MYSRNETDPMFGIVRAILELVMTRKKNSLKTEMMSHMMKLNLRLPDDDPICSIQMISVLRIKISLYEV